jgi:hypothetical protein
MECLSPILGALKGQSKGGTCKCSESFCRAGGGISLLAEESRGPQKAHRTKILFHHYPFCNGFHGGNDIPTIPFGLNFHGFYQPSDADRPVGGKVASINIEESGPAKILGREQKIIFYMGTDRKKPAAIGMHGESLACVSRIISKDKTERFTQTRASNLHGGNGFAKSIGGNIDSVDFVVSTGTADVEDHGFYTLGIGGGYEGLENLPSFTLALDSYFSPAILNDQFLNFCKIKTGGKALLIHCAEDASPLQLAIQSIEGKHPHKNNTRDDGSGG